MPLTSPPEVPCHPRFRPYPSPGNTGGQARKANEKPPFIGTLTRQVTAASEAAQLSGLADDEVQQAVGDEDGPGQLSAFEPRNNTAVGARQGQGLLLRGAPLDVQTPADLPVDLHDERHAGRRREFFVERRPGILNEEFVLSESLPPLVGQVRSDGMKQFQKRQRAAPHGGGVLFTGL